MKSAAKRLWYRAQAALTLPRLRARRALIGLCYHRFENQRGDDPLPGMAVTPSALARQLEFLSGLGRFVSLEEVFDPDPAPGLRFWLSFDDGYRDNAEILPSLLGRLGVPATLFVTHGFITGEVPQLQHDRRLGFAPSAMAPARLKELAANPLFSVGTHTFSHPRLDLFNEPYWETEVSAPRLWTAKLTGTPVRDLAYPFGGPADFDWVDGPSFLLRHGFRSVCSNFGGWNSPKRPDRLGAGAFALTHLKRIPMIGSPDPALVAGWIARMATRGGRRA